jgi:hypothetical protein
MLLTVHSPQEIVCWKEKNVTPHLFNKLNCWLLLIWTDRGKIGLLEQCIYLEKKLDDVRGRRQDGWNFRGWPKGDIKFKPEYIHFKFQSWIFWKEPTVVLFYCVFLECIPGSEKLSIVVILICQTCGYNRSTCTVSSLSCQTKRCSRFCPSWKVSSDSV